MRGNKKKNVMPIFFCGGPKKKTKKGQVLTKNEYKNKVRGYDENLIFRTHSVVNVATRPHVRWLTQLNGRAVHIYFIFISKNKKSMGAMVASWLGR